MLNDNSYNTGPVGGQDGAGLVFTNIPTRSYSKITSWSLTTWDYNGTGRIYTTNPSWTPGNSSNYYAVIFSAQDSILGTSSTSGFYTWYKGTVFVSFDSTFTDSGSVQMTYGHDWTSTNLSSVQFGAGGSNDISLTGSVTYTFNNPNKMAVGGLWTAY